MTSAESEAIAGVPTAAPGKKRLRGRVLGIAASVVLLVLLYRSVDLGAVIGVLKRADPVWVVVSIGMIAPITLLRAMRFAWTAPKGAVSGVGEALRLTLVASAFNTFLPSKAGDLAKSLFVARVGRASAGVAISIVAYERASDVFGLLSWTVGAWLLNRERLGVLPDYVWILLGVLWIVSGVLVLSQRAAIWLERVFERLLRFPVFARLRGLAAGWPELHRELKGRKLFLAGFAFVLWFVQLVQIWLFSVAVGAGIPFVVCASLSAVALMIGQLPFTFSGLGARDVALVLLLAGHVPPETAAAMGILTATRGLLPPLAALPLLRPYFSTVAESRGGLTKP